MFTTEIRRTSDRVEVRCTECGEIKSVPFTAAQQAAYAAGGLIQRVAPNLSEDDRELLISGTCGKCFEKLFEGEEV